MNSRLASEYTRSYPIAVQLKRVLQLFRETLDEALRPYGVTSAQLKVLATLEQEPGISGARLARQFLVTPQTTQVLLRGIEANGWIERRQHPENSRILLATLTPAGKRLLGRSRTAVGKIYARMLQGLSAKEVRELEELLGRCEANLGPSRSVTRDLSEGCEIKPKRRRV
jgi:DNA-binding MarR family transcriptional regulator